MLYLLHQFFFTGTTPFFFPVHLYKKEYSEAT